jgi:hypothetical protein
MRDLDNTPLTGRYSRLRSVQRSGRSQVDTGMPASVYPAAHAFPVSVKGVAVQDGKVLLLETSGASGSCPGEA